MRRPAQQEGERWPATESGDFGARPRGELLLELLSEEIPAGMQRRAIEALSELLRERLLAAEIPASDLRGYVTPRRLTMIARGILETQPDRIEERRGPRVGAPRPAIEGFLRSAGITSIEECEVRDTGRGEFFFATVRRAGRPAAEVLPELVNAAIFDLPWPKSMRYPAASLRWVRPLTSVICLFSGEVLPLPLDRVPVGRVTRGHRFLAPGEICVRGAGEYLEKIHAAHVVLDQNARRDIIREGLERAALNEGLMLKHDPGLLDEVTGLVEFPVVLSGAIDSEFMALPPEVLATAMRAHQRFFSCLYPDDAPAPRFLFVANNIAADGGDTIIAGNERVLRARLADARFFWDQDRRVPLASRVDALKGRVYYDKLGTMYDKTERIQLLAEALVPHVPGSERDGACRAALLAKADLSTGMVGEFPELQGIMGRYYARNDEEDRRVADAIAEHYKPLGPNDACPTAPISAVVALADKIDTLATFFAIGEKPTGSRDPFALRRAALGLIRLIIKNGFRIPLGFAFQRAVQNYDPTLFGLRDPTIELLPFIDERLRVHLRDKGVRHDLINAVFARSDEDLVGRLNRLHAVETFLASDNGENLLTAYRRASNIVAIEERRDGRFYDGDFDRQLLMQPEEQRLGRVLEYIDSGDQPFAALIRREKFEEAVTALSQLRYPVDAFFEKVTVNTDEKVVVYGQEKSLRENRLRLLSRIRAVMNMVADFSEIEG